VCHTSNLLFIVPPSFNLYLRSHTFTKLLPFAAVLHLILGIWMLSNPLIFPAEDAIEEAQLVSSQVGEVGGEEAAD